MKTIVLFLTILMPVLSFGFNGENTDGFGTIKGKVNTSDNKPASSVTLQLKGTLKKATTDDNGAFAISKIVAGTYQLEVSLVGYETFTQTVTVEKNKTVTVNIQLKVSEKQLEEVTVTTGNNKFVKNSTDYVARMPLKNLENPQVYNSISKELLQEQVVSNFDDAIKNTSGIDKLWSSTGRGGDGAAYFSVRGFSVQPSLVNGIAGLTNGSPDPAGIERLEVIKGPSGTLFGSSLVSFGGLINIVTKRPYETFGGEVGYTAGSFGLNRLTADINTPLNAAKGLFMRVNTAYHYEGSFQDAGFKKTFYIAPSFLYKVSDRLTLSLNTEFYSSESTNALSLFINRTRPLVARTPSELNFNFNRSYTNNDLTIKTPTINIYGQVNYKLSDKWTSQTNFSRSNRKSDGYYQYSMFAQTDVDTLLTRYVSYQNATGTSTGLQQNFIGDFSIGKMRNRVVLGLDYLSTQTQNNSSPYITFDNINVTKPDNVRYQSLSKAAVDLRIAQSALAPTRNGTQSDTYSAYVSDVINITDNLMAMLSLRLDYFDNKGTFNYATAAQSGQFTQTSVSPKLGLVYQLVKDKVSLFGNYMNGFKNVAPVTQPFSDIDGNFKPQHANQFEAGVKLDAVNHKLVFTASYYDISVENTTRADVIIRNNTTYNITVQDGTQLSKGVEFEAIANPLPGLNIVAGYSYNNSKITKADTSVVNRRANSAGPEQLANFWASYSLLNGKLKGFGLGFGGNYASDNIVTNNSKTGQFIAPAYTVLNATIFYNTRSFRLGLKVDNLTNKEYFKGWSTIEMQKPRSVSANLIFKI